MVEVEAKISHCGIQEILKFAVAGSQTYTVLPKAIWRKLKLAPQKLQCPESDSGFSLSECLIEIGQKTYQTIAILGDKNDRAQLGMMLPAGRNLAARGIERRLRRR